MKKKKFYSEISELNESWDDLLETLWDDESLDIISFKKLFVHTWEYLKGETDSERMNRNAVELIRKVCALADYRGGLPDDCRYWESDAVFACADGLLYSISSTDDYEGYHFTDGVIWVSLAHNGERHIRLDEFDSNFDELCQIFREDYDDEDEDDLS